jgi:hypothetical protein
VAATLPLRYAGDGSPAQYAVWSTVPKPNVGEGSDRRTTTELTGGHHGQRQQCAEEGSEETQAGLDQESSEGCEEEVAFIVAVRSAGFIGQRGMWGTARWVNSDVGAELTHAPERLPRALVVLQLVGGFAPGDAGRSALSGRYV